jgi:hypothetical protein
VLIFTISAIASANEGEDMEQQHALGVGRRVKQRGEVIGRRYAIQRSASNQLHGGGVVNRMWQVRGYSGCFFLKIFFCSVCQQVEHDRRILVHIPVFAAVPPPISLSLSLSLARSLARSYARLCSLLLHFTSLCRCYELAILRWGDLSLRQ